jgi:hypothetical protein
MNPDAPVTSTGSRSVDETGTMTCHSRSLMYELDDRADASRQRPAVSSYTPRMSVPDPPVPHFTGSRLQLRRPDLEGVTFHSLRHSAAGLMPSPDLPADRFEGQPRRR